MNIVVIGAHPDDPESCCGGLTLNAIKAGHHVMFLFLSSGFHDLCYGGRPIVEVRESQSRAACAMLGVEPQCHEVKLHLSCLTGLGAFRGGVCLRVCMAWGDV